jgi:hypothetical protein
MAVFRIFALAISVSLLLPTTVTYALGWEDVAGCAVLACVPTIVKGAVDDTADHLSGDAKKLYLDVMNDFVSTKLPTMLSQIDTLASKHETTIKSIVDEIKGISDSLIQEINKGIKDVNLLIKTTFKKADAFVDKVACEAEGAASKTMIDAQNGLKKIINDYTPQWLIRQDQCEVRFGTPDINEPAKVISLKDCELTLQIKDSDPNVLKVIDMRNNYADLLDLVYVIKCLPHPVQEVNALDDLESTIREEYQTWNAALGVTYIP